MILRDALRMLRSEIGLTQSELADAVNVGYSAESRWENKNTRPNKASSLAILALAKKHCVSSVCLDSLTNILMASRADDKDDRALAAEVRKRMKLERYELLTSEQLKTTIDNLDLAVIGHRIYSGSPVNTVVFYHNRRYSEIFGYSEDEFEKKSIEDIYFGIPADSRDKYQTMVARLLAGEINMPEFVVTLRGFKKDGAEIWLEIKCISLTRYAFGYEMFISCSDVTGRVDAERKYAEEVAVRDASLRGFYANFHCDLAANTVYRHRNLADVVGRDYDGESADVMLEKLAASLLESPAREEFTQKFSRAFLSAAYERGDTFGNVSAFNTVSRRWFRYDYILMKNPYTGHTEAAVYVYDIQNQTVAEKMTQIVADRFFEFIGLIDADTRTFESYYYADGVFHETVSERRSYPTVCDEKLRLFGDPADYAAQRTATSLDTVVQKLRKKTFYSIVLRLRDYDGKMKLKKVTYTYLDDTKTTIVMAQCDMEGLKMTVIGDMPGDSAAERRHHK